jgi:predicted nuclease of restriction endonuclease-like RecB superfamily
LLTADLVEVRRRGDQLSLRKLTPEERLQALGLAEIYVDLCRAHVGRPRALLLDALKEVEVPAAQRRLAGGLCKLALDACHFEEEAAGIDPTALRAELFAAATEHRRALSPQFRFDRATSIEAVAARHGVDAASIERTLYADLPEAQVLIAANLAGPRALVAAYEAAGVEAVLLRAVSVHAQITEASPSAYRHLFRKLKFLRLLYQIQPITRRNSKAIAGYDITIDGPYSMFESVTRYGLQLALAYRALVGCGRFVINADLRWGKERRALKFVERGDPDDTATAETSSAETTANEDPALPPEVAGLLHDLRAQPGHFVARPSRRLMPLPGAGIVVPDLELEHTPTGRCVQVEVLGFWSRDAVWRRIELAERGLPEPILFAVSKHLRVSEAALPAEHGAALYVYAHKLSARAVLERAAQLIARSQL